jgi:hypothetical protein
MSNFYFDYEKFYKYYTNDKKLKTDTSSLKEIWFYRSSQSREPEKETLSNKYIIVNGVNIYISKKENDKLYFTIPETIGDKLWDFHYHFGNDRITPADDKYQPIHRNDDNKIPAIYFHKTIQNPLLNRKERKNCYYHPTMDVDNIEDIICLQAKNSKMGKMFPPNTQDFKIIKEIISRPFPKKQKKTFLEALTSNNTTQIKPSGKGGTKKKIRRNHRKTIRRR